MFKLGGEFSEPPTPLHVVDPWHVTGLESSCFNPLDWLDPNDPDISEKALILADSIVVGQHQSSADPFWNDEARALLMGILLFVALDEGESDRDLGRVRDIIVADADEFDSILARMFQNSNPIVRSTAARTASKEPKLRSNVLASLQAHTHFLDSPRIRESLKRSDFKFQDLKTSKMTVYLVLPADRLQTFGRWLRLLVQQALTVNARNLTVKPDKPILFLLDEMAALGRLTMVEQAFALMAGFGMQLWGIVQDLSQLEKIYDKGWETFVGNSGVLQYFGSRDQKTAEYFSKLCGVTTVQKIFVQQRDFTCRGLHRERWQHHHHDIEDLQLRCGATPTALSRRTHGDARQYFTGSCRELRPDLGLQGAMVRGRAAKAPRCRPA